MILSIIVNNIKYIIVYVQVRVCVRARACLGVCFYALPVIQSSPLAIKSDIIVFLDNVHMSFAFS